MAAVRLGITPEEIRERKWAGGAGQAVSEEVVGRKVKPNQSGENIDDITSKRGISHIYLHK